MNIFEGRTPIEIINFLFMAFVLAPVYLKAMIIGSDFNFGHWWKYGKHYTRWYNNRPQFDPEKDLPKNKCPDQKCGGTLEVLNIQAEFFIYGKGNCHYIHIIRKCNMCERTYQSEEEKEMTERNKQLAIENYHAERGNV